MNKEYKIKYNKEHYKAFKVDLKIDELEQLEVILKTLNKTKAQFLRDAIKQLTDCTYKLNINK